MSKLASISLNLKAKDYVIDDGQYCSDQQEVRQRATYNPACIFFLWMASPLFIPPDAPSNEN